MLVKCINNSSFEKNLTIGTTYLVQSEFNGFYGIRDNTGRDKITYRTERFEIVKPKEIYEQDNMKKASTKTFVEIEFKYSLGDVVYYVNNNQIVKGVISARSYEETQLNPPSTKTYTVPPATGGLNIRLWETKIHSTPEEAVKDLKILDKSL